MTIPQSLEMECSRCRVAGTCPSKGSSPLLKGGKRFALCRLLGGYGRNPADPEILSPESLMASKRDGECLTIAEVPKFDESGNLHYEMVKVFAPAQLHAREKNVMTVDSVYPRSHKP